MLQQSRLCRSWWPFLTACALSLSIGCKGEDDPEYWIEKLEQPSSRPSAFSEIEKRLESKQEGSENAAPENAAPEKAPEKAASEKPAPGTFPDRMLKALASYYSTNFDRLDADTRTRLLELITSSEHEAAAAAVERAFAGYANGKTSLPELDLAMDAALELPPKSVGVPLVSAFKAFRASAEYERSLKFWRVLLRHASPAWQDPMLATLLAPIISARQVGNQDDTNARSDQIFWQTAAVEVLGAIGGQAVVEPILKVVLDDGKLDLHGMALLALVRVGEPVLRRTRQLITNPSDPLAAFSQAHEPTDLPPDLKGAYHVVQGALILGEMKRKEAIEPLLKALEQAKSDILQAAIARELAKQPKTPESLEAFKRTHDELAEQQVSGERSLVESADYFFDPELVPWLLEQVERIQDPKDEVGYHVQNPALMTAVRLMIPDQVDLVRPVVEKRKVEGEVDAFKRTAALLERCKRQMSCYLIALTAKESQMGLGQVIGVKAALMLGILGNQQVRTAIIQRYGRITSPAIQLAAARAIEHLTQADAAATADALDKLIAHSQQTSKPKPRDLPLEYVRWRLANRAGP